MESNNGFFNQYGGKYVAEVLRRPLDELEVEFKKAMADPEFVKELETIQRDYIGRETPLLYAETATKLLGGAQIYIKLEGLANTGAHKINVLVACGETCKTVPKISSIYFFAPGTHTKGDGYLYQNRSLSDTFVFPNGKDGKVDSVFVDTDTAAVV